MINVTCWLIADRPSCTLDLWVWITWTDSALSVCWDGRAAFHKSDIRFRVCVGGRG